MKVHAFPDESVSMELVVTGMKALVVTVVFYDSFSGNVAEFVKPLEDLAGNLKLPVVAKSHWASWYETAAALWPAIAGQKGNPLAMLQHCMGTTGIPDDGVLDCICTTVVAEAALSAKRLSRSWRFGRWAALLCRGESFPVAIAITRFYRRHHPLRRKRQDRRRAADHRRPHQPTH